MARLRQQLLVTTALCLASLPAWAADNPPLTYCTNSPPEGFDTLQYALVATHTVSAMPLFNRLVDFRAGSTEMVPSLAREWHIAPDGKAVTIHLMPNVRFHTTAYFRPTRTFNADDVIFTFGRITQKDHPFNRAYPTIFPFPLDPGLHSNVLRIVRVNDLTVRFELNRPDADFMEKLVLASGSIQSAEYAQQLLQKGQAARIDSQPVGTGPFQLDGQPDKTVFRFRAHPGYWRTGLPKARQLVIRAVTDPEQRSKDTLAGRCDIFSFPRKSDVDRFRKEPGFMVQETPSLSLGFIAYNTSRPPLDRLEVRQALDMALDRKAMLVPVYENFVSIAANILPRSLAGFDPALQNPPYDPEQARALLQKAGVKPGLKISLVISPLRSSVNPHPDRLAERIKADWAKIGVTAVLIEEPFKAYRDRLSRRDFGAAQLGWVADYPSPENFLVPLLTCDAIGRMNFAGYCNPTFDRLLESASSERLPRKRAGIYRTAQRLVKADVPWSTLIHVQDAVVLSKRVQGFRISPFSFVQFEEVSLIP